MHIHSFSISAHLGSLRMLKPMASTSSSFGVTLFSLHLSSIRLTQRWLVITVDWIDWKHACRSLLGCHKSAWLLSVQPVVWHLHGEGYRWIRRLPRVGCSSGQDQCPPEGWVHHPQTGFCPDDRGSVSSRENWIFFWCCNWQGMQLSNVVEK